MGTNPPHSHLQTGMIRQNPRIFRLSATVAIGALLCNAATPIAMAQAPPPPAGQPGQTPPGQSPPGQNQGDPPDRVGRIASATGAVSFRTSADTDWSAATANYPVSAGNAFWTEPNARAELEISASRIDLSGQTEFDVTTLDAGGLQAVAPQGEMYLHVLDLAPNEVWSVQTPRGMVRLTQAGRYGIVVGTTEQPTQVTVLEGAAEIEGPGVSLKIAANQTATVTGADTFQGSVGPAVRDAFLAARLGADRPPPQRTAAIPAQIAYMPGGEDLQTYGEWSQAPDYGEVWYPPVSPTWVPYRDGQWAYVAPWGWTWVDAAPWGFAPFHYGRWAHIGPRWGWVPGEESARERPVYAPALVTFIGVGAGLAVGAAIAHRSVGWVPLGPREAYHPWYHASDNYVRQVNAGHVRDATTINNNVAINNFANRAAATSVPASIMTGSRPVRVAARPISQQAFAAAHPVIGQQPIGPTVRTLGVTPAVARQLDLHAAGPQVPARRPAPGPVVRVQEPGAEKGPPPRPALIGSHGEQPGGPRPGEPAGPGPGATHAPGVPPPLTGPGPRPSGVPEGARPSGQPSGTAAPPGQPPRPATSQGQPASIAAPPPGPRPEGVPRPGTAPEVTRPGGPPPLAAPGTPPAGVPGTPPPGGRPPSVERPTPGANPTAPGGHEPPPHVVTPEAAHPAPPPHIATPEAPRAAPPPHIATPEAPRPAPPPHVEAPRPASPPPPPHVTAPAPPPPPHVEAPRPAPPPPPHVEAPRPAPPPPPPHVTAPAPPPPNPAPPPPQRAAPPPPPPPRAAAPPPPPPRPAAPPPHAAPEKKPGEH